MEHLRNVDDFSGYPHFRKPPISGWRLQPILKNMKVNGKDYPIYYGNKMFETTSQSNMVAGWWFQPSEKYEFVSWDDDIPNI
jgi:hypothetical protein